MIEEGEVITRAERVATLFFKKDDPKFSHLVQVIANELKQLASECGWQREELREVLNKVVH